jgi:hypothetical protein
MRTSNTFSRVALATAAAVAVGVLAACGSSPSAAPRGGSPVLSASQPVSRAGTGTTTSSTPAASGLRPSEEQVLAAISKDGNAAGIPAGRLTKAQLTCVAKVIVDSPMSDAALQALVAGDSRYDSSADDNAVGIIAPRLRGCTR